MPLVSVFKYCPLIGQCVGPPPRHSPGPLRWLADVGAKPSRLSQVAGRHPLGFWRFQRLRLSCTGLSQLTEKSIDPWCGEGVPDIPGMISRLLVVCWDSPLELSVSAVCRPSPVWPLNRALSGSHLVWAAAAGTAELAECEPSRERHGPQPDKLRQLSQSSGGSHGCVL